LGVGNAVTGDCVDHHWTGAFLQEESKRRLHGKELFKTGFLLCLVELLKHGPEVYELVGSLAAVQCVEFETLKGQGAKIHADEPTGQGIVLVHELAEVIKGGKDLERSSSSTLEHQKHRTHMEDPDGELDFRWSLGTGKRGQSVQGPGVFLVVEKGGELLKAEGHGGA